MKLECNNCDWIGDSDDAVALGAIYPLCPECNETTTPALSADEESRGSDDA